MMRTLLGLRMMLVLKLASLVKARHPFTAVRSLINKSLSTGPDSFKLLFCRAQLRYFLKGALHVQHPYFSTNQIHNLWRFHPHCVIYPMS